MFCPKCKSEIPDDSVFCLKCGSQIKGEPLTVTIHEAAQMIGCTTQTVLNLCGRKLITACNITTGRMTYINRQSVIDFCTYFPSSDRERLITHKKIADLYNGVRKLTTHIDLKIFDTIARAYLNDKDVELLGDFQKFRTIEEICVKEDMSRKELERRVNNIFKTLEDKMSGHEAPHIVSTSASGASKSDMDRLMAERYNTEDIRKKLECAEFPITKTSLDDSTVKTLLLYNIYDLKELVPLSVEELRGMLVTRRAVTAVFRQMELYGLRTRTGSADYKSREEDTEAAREINRQRYIELVGSDYKGKAPRKATLDAIEWRRNSIGFQWVAEQYHAGRPLKEILEEFNERHKTDKRFSSYYGYEITMSILQKWTSEIQNGTYGKF